ncbi:DnaJ-domain-containing protein, partial [Trichocladium antarcticum]
MPLRYTPAGAALHRFTAAVPGGRRFFHASRRLEADVHPNNNHYETLNVHQDASPAEIKKSFYHLSKRHHPDHNPADPLAPNKFMRLSEAYAVLGHTDKRARYDRDVLRHHQRAHGRHNHGPSPSSSSGSSYHSSTGPAGGRPASGLSRRRSAFQGPPPSFFRSGGWGAHGAKRRAAHDESTG